MIETPHILIAGAGPVGLTLAIDLASRGVSVTIVEPRAPGEPPSVKCNHVSARTMEVFRRLGVAQKVRDAGLPSDYPNDIAFRTTTIGTERSAIRRRGGRTPGGQRPSHRTGSIRSSSSLSCSNMPVRRS